MLFRQLTVRYHQIGPPFFGEADFWFIALRKTPGSSLLSTKYSIPHHKKLKLGRGRAVFYACGTDVSNKAFWSICTYPCISPSRNKYTFASSPIFSNSDLSDGFLDSTLNKRSLKFCNTSVVVMLQPIELGWATNRTTACSSTAVIMAEPLPTFRALTSSLKMMVTFQTEHRYIKNFCIISTCYDNE